MTPIARLLTTVLVGLAIFVSLGAWSLSSPVGAAPDDDFHLASIWCGNGIRDGLCEPGSHADSRMVPDKIVKSACYAFHAETSGDCQGKGYQDEGYRLTETTRLNGDSGQYPSGYYWWMSHLASDNVAVSTIAIRLVNAALFSILMVGTWRLLPRRFRFTLSAGMALTAVPLAMFIIPSTNPSSWSIISIAIMFPALLGYFGAQGWRAWTLGGIALLSALLGLGARGDSAAYAAVAVCAAVVLSFRHDRAFYLRALLPVLLLVLAVVAFLSAGQTAIAIGGMGDSNTTMSTTGLIIANLLEMPNLWLGIFSHVWGLGWLDTQMPAQVWATTMFCAFGVLFLAIRWRGWRKVLAVTGVTLSALLVPLYILVSSHVTVGSQVQPRYILPLLTLVVATALAPSADPQGRDRNGVVLTAPQLWTIAALLTLANALALYANLHRYTGIGTMRLSGQVAWWWQAAPIPAVTYLIGIAAFAAAMAAFALTAQRARPDGPVTEEGLVVHEGPAAGPVTDKRPAAVAGPAAEAEAAPRTSGVAQPA